jgi:AraC-like DNA-binding protein
MEAVGFPVLPWRGEEAALDLFQVFALIAAVITFLVAAVFRINKVLNGWFCLFLIAVGLLILPFSMPPEGIQESRLAHPVIYFAVNALIILVFPLFFMSVRIRVGLPLGPGDWPYLLLFGVSTAALCLESLGVDLDGLVSRVVSAPIPPPPQAYMGMIRSVWQDFHHAAFTVSAGVLLFAGKRDGLEIRILRWTSVYVLVVIAASILLEWLKPRLDLMVTSALLSATIFTFIAFLIIRSPALIRGSRKKYGGSRLTAGESRIILERLTRLMGEEKAFKDPGFDLPEAARRIKTSVPNLSQAVNQGLDMSFNRAVNGYRVREAKRLLRDEDLSITVIAFESGFGSLSSFNAVFKAECGLSPSEYRRNGKNPLPSL